MSSMYFQNAWAFWIWLAALVFIAAEIFLRRKMNPSVLARIAWISLLGFVIADLTFVNSTQWSQPEAIKIFVDRSDSISLIPARKARAEKFLQEIKDWSLSKKLPIQLYSFGEHVLEERDNIQWGSLRTLLQPAEEKMSGVSLVISEGLWTDYAQSRTPVFGVNLGDENEKDIWIEKLQPVFTAFLKNRLKIPVTIGQKGFTGQHARIALWRSNEKVSEQEVRLEKNETIVEFNYFPEKMGEQTFLVKIEPLDGELTAINNEVPMRVRTVRDKIRILHIGGKPSLDLKAWRLFLTHQPDVDLVSFYILRSVSDDPEAKNSELSLIPFPYEELFSTELEKFDLVILQNFDFNLYFPPFYLANLARFVHEGGALLMMGGDQSFHRYRGSPLEAIFPFRFKGEGDFNQQTLTVEPGAEHPITDGLESAFQIPKWTARHRIFDDPDSVTLLRYQTGIPMISIRQVDKGRIAGINSDELWKLQMQPTREDAPVFGKFARRMLQYLTFDPEVNPPGILSGVWKAGQAVSLKTANHQKTNWKIRSLAFRPLEMSYRGESEINFIIPFPGIFEVSVESLADSQIFETSEQPWKSEWKNILGDFDRLQKISDLSGGRAFSYEDRKKILDLPISGKQMISADISSWSRNAQGFSWLILLATIGLMCVDFFFRKKNHWDA